MENPDELKRAMMDQDNWRQHAKMLQAEIQPKKYI